MEVKPPAKEKQDLKVNNLIQQLLGNLKSVNEIKAKLVKFQKYEVVAEFCEVEKHLEISIEKLTNIGTDTNTTTSKIIAFP